MAQTRKMRLALVALVLTTMVACRAANSNDCTQRITEDCMSRREFTWEEANAVRDKHYDKIGRQPHFLGGGAGIEYGIRAGRRILTARRRSASPLACRSLRTRAPCPKRTGSGTVLDGVPVYFHVTEANTTMGGLERRAPARRLR